MKAGWLSTTTAATLEAVALAMLASGCALLAPPDRVPDAPSVAAPPAALVAAAEATALRERIRAHARVHCGGCHQAPSAQPAALKIYDLDQPNWYESLTVARLQGGFPRRLNSRLDETGRRDLAAFVAHEVALRQR